jgi:hypothetical protein
LVSEAVPHGMARLYLSAGVSFLREEDAIFDAMLAGWAAQQRGGLCIKRCFRPDALNEVSAGKVP